MIHPSNDCPVSTRPVHEEACGTAACQIEWKISEWNDVSLKVLQAWLKLFDVLRLSPSALVHAGKMQECSTDWCCVTM